MCDGGGSLLHEFDAKRCTAGEPGKREPEIAAVPIQLEAPPLRRGAEPRVSCQRCKTFVEVGKTCKSKHCKKRAAEKDS